MLPGSRRASEPCPGFGSSSLTVLPHKSAPGIPSSEKGKPYRIKQTRSGKPRHQEQRRRVEGMQSSAPLCFLMAKLSTPKPSVNLSGTVTVS